ncbi:MAG: histidine kinase dimerization/phosphoacceptor domain -containing protein [Caulobacteraceae bacterium]
MLVLMLTSNWLLGTMKTSRDRLAVERERYARLAENRDLLYRELQHRVSNNIQLISGLLLLQSQGVSDKAAKRALAEGVGPHQPDRPHPAPAARPDRRTRAVQPLRPRPAHRRPGGRRGGRRLPRDRGRRRSPARRTGHAGVAGAAGMREQRPGAWLSPRRGGQCPRVPDPRRRPPRADRGRRRRRPAEGFDISGGRSLG